jgi:hypothetical protein
MIEIDCPECGETANAHEIEHIRGEELPVTVARRQTGFNGGVTSLHEMAAFAFMVRMPCGCEILTVN